MGLMAHFMPENVQDASIFNIDVRFWLDKRVINDHRPIQFGSGYSRPSELMLVIVL